MRIGVIIGSTRPGRNGEKVATWFMDQVTAHQEGSESNDVTYELVDLAEFDPAARGPMRAALGVSADTLLVGWVGRLDRKKRVEDVIAAALRIDDPRARFLIVGGPDAFMPEYADELRRMAAPLGDRIIFTGDRKDVPDLLAAMDVFCWLSRGEGMPHVIAEAGAAGLPVIATPDNGALQQIRDGETGLFVPHEDPAAVAAAIRRLLDDAALRRELATPRPLTSRFAGYSDETRSELAIVEGQYFEVLARRGRLEAERADQPGITFPEELTKIAAERADVQAMMDGQTSLFRSRLDTLRQSTDQLDKQAQQVRQQIEGIDAQTVALDDQRRLIGQELKDQRNLLDKGLAQAPRVLALQREAARLDGAGDAADPGRGGRSGRRRPGSAESHPRGECASTTGGRSPRGPPAGRAPRSTGRPGRAGRRSCPPCRPAAPRRTRRAQARRSAGFRHPRPGEGRLHLGRPRTSPPALRGAGRER